MTKHHWRQQIKSFFDSHADPDKHEQQKQTRKDMEEKKEKIIKLINGEDQAVSSNGKAQSLEEHIKDYHKQYESLYELYHNLTGELRNKVHPKKDEKKDTFSSSSSSDSDPNTDKSHSKQGARKNRKLENESLKQELEAANREIDNLRKKLAAADDEKEALRSELESSKAGLVSKMEIMNKSENENAELRSKVVDLELNVEDLKRDVEMDKDEMVSIEEKNRSLEVMLRLSNQKLRLTEQLLSEKEEEHHVLDARNTALGQTLEEYSAMIKEISERVNALVGQLEYETTKKFDKDYGGLAKSIAKLSEEVKGVKSWVVGLRVKKEEMEKVVMEEDARVLDEAVKEKEERFLRLGEEKRDAIRHLCVWIEYYRSRCIELQRILLKVAPRERRITPP